ncbi:MAG: hypothetical protein AAFR96_09910 [Planctomycetota bacterium]
MSAAGVDSGTVLQGVSKAAEAAGVFAGVTIRGHELLCDADGSAEPATYGIRIEDNGSVWAYLAMEDRWQNGSIEADLVHTGDKVEELLDEELAELGYDSRANPAPTFQHFRSEEMLFTFQSPVPVEGLSAEAAAERAAQWLLAYEACFRQLGDMSEPEED